MWNDMKLDQLDGGLNFIDIGASGGFPRDWNQLKRLINYFAFEPNAEECEASIEKSLSMVTSLNPHIGYEMASKIAKEAFQTGKTIRELCQEKELLPEETLSEALDPQRMTEPQE